MFDPLALLWAAFVFLIILSAVSDLASFTIPNTVVIAVIGLFIPAWILSGSNFVGLGTSFASSLILFVVGFVLFTRGALGGGDVKLIAAIGLWTGLWHLPRFLLVMAIAGGGLAMAAIFVALAKSFLKKQKIKGIRSITEIRIPYGVAIAIAALDFVARANRLTWLG